MDKRTIIAVALSVVIIVIPAGEQSGQTAQSIEPRSSPEATEGGTDEIAEAEDKTTPEGSASEVVPSDAIVAEEIKEDIPSAPETKTPEEKEEAAEKVAEEVAEESEVVVEKIAKANL